MELRSEGNFLSAIQMLKVIVTTDDLTVFALAADGKVYYKRQQESDFMLKSLSGSLTLIR
ncbi:hypothetical protein PBAL39_20980 [Pedobacter sp. BAL39]|nr:hypothetical protein PBAL39_20980 [Pedobacter sp. BAL39]